MARSPSGAHDDSPQRRGGSVVGISGAVSVHPSTGCQAFIYLSTAWTRAGQRGSELNGLNGSFYNERGGEGTLFSVNPDRRRPS